MNAARAAKLQGAVDDQVAESILIEPMTAPTLSGVPDVNARPVAVTDGSRPAVTVAGVWAEPQEEYARRPHGRSDVKNRDIAAQRPQVKIQAVLVPYALAVGDRLTRIATGQRYEAAIVGGDGYGRILVSLTARGS
jgi:hypothetical protein